MSNSIKLTVSQFAKCWGKTPQHVNTYVNRGKLVKGYDKKIHIDNPVNKLFINERLAKGETFDLMRINSDSATLKRSNVSRMDIDTLENKSKSFEQFKELELEKKLTEIERIKSQVELNNIKIKKSQGELIPFEEAKFILIRSISEFENSYKAIAESILNIANNSGGNYHSSLKEIHEEIGQASNEAKQTLLKEVENLAAECSELLERGQKRS